MGLVLREKKNKCRKRKKEITFELFFFTQQVAFSPLSLSLSLFSLFSPSLSLSKGRHSPHSSPSAMKKKQRERDDALCFLF
jgi:hypothetical protein